MTTTHWFQSDNPLTRHLRKFESIDDIGAALRYSPLDGLEIRGLSQFERYELLMAEKTPLQPTATSTVAAMTMVAMHRASLRARNPALASGRRLVHDMIEAAKSGAPMMSQPPAPGACLFIMKGITGTAKTVTAKLTLDRLIGQQVIKHVDEEAAYLSSATQISWLFVGMSHDGTRGGLLTAILLAVDRLLGTSHAREMPKLYKSVERLAGGVIALLHTYYVGILVIDEIQALNMVESQYAELMQLFILSLVNSGIPVVLSGNPYGFAWLSEYSQNLSRGVERSAVFFHPCGALGDTEDDDWEVVFNGICSYYVLDQPMRDRAACSSTLKRRSGGIQRVALAIWCNAQADILLDGGLTLTPEDLEAVYASESFEEMRPLCDGFAQKDPRLLLKWRYRDIPVDLYAAAWGRQIEEPEDMSPVPPPSVSRAPESKRTSGASMKAAETRKRNLEQARKERALSLPPEDMRIQGIKRHHLASLAEMMRAMEGGTDLPGAA